jgi:hypothetical protein
VDPITGGAIAFLGSFGDVAYETFNLPVQIFRGVFNGAAKVVKKLDSSDRSRRIEVEHGREDVSSQNSTVAPIQRHCQERDNESPDSWQDIFDQSFQVVATTGKGMGRLTKAYLCSPLHFSLGLARGFQ